MAEMCKHPRLQRRGAVYWFRCRIPADLIDRYGKKEILESLRTRDATEALRLVRARSEAQQQEFDRIRAGQTVTELTDEEVQGIAREHYFNTLLVDQISREHGLTEEQYEALEVGIEEGESTLGQALPVGDISQVEHLVDASLKRRSIVLQKDSSSYRRLGYAMLQAAVKANDALRNRQQGNIGDTPNPSPVHISKVRRGVTVEDVLGRWASERKPRSKTTEEWTAIVGDFTRLHGELPLQDIAKAHVVAYKDNLVQGKLASGTIKKKLAALHGLLQYALENDLCDRNAASGVRVRGGEKSRL